MKMQIVGKGNENAYYFAFKQCQIIAQGAGILLSNLRDSGTTREKDLILNQNQDDKKKVYFFFCWGSLMGNHLAVVYLVRKGC